MVSPDIHFSWHSLVSVQCHLGLYSELSGRHRAVPLTQIGLSCWIVPILRSKAILRALWTGALNACNLVRRYFNSIVRQDTDGPKV